MELRSSLCASYIRDFGCVTSHRTKVLLVNLTFMSMKECREKRFRTGDDISEECKLGWDE